MGTIDRQDGFRFVIYPNDHRPAHVHAYKAEGVAVIEIEAETVSVREAHDMKPADVKRAVRIVKRNQERYLAEWEWRHGTHGR